MSGHTPGPWTYDRLNWRGGDGGPYWFIRGEHYEEDEDNEDSGEPCHVSTAVARVEGNATSHPICEANARLIAAAPCLLAAAKELIDAAESENWDRYRGTDEPRNGIAALRAAIAKAEGT